MKMKIRNRENRKNWTGFRDLADFFTGNQDPTSPLVSPLIKNLPKKGSLSSLLLLIMRRSNCSAPILPGHTRGITFFACPGPLINLLFLCPPYIVTNFTLFSSAQPFFYHTQFSSDPGSAPGGGDRGRTIWPAHKGYQSVNGDEVVENVELITHMKFQSVFLTRCK